MNVRIEERPTFKVVGVKEEISLKDGANLLEIPKFWERVNLDGTANKISDLSHGELVGLVGI
ncbi:MAG: AraC family transcriptional regulator, partial [Carnobacterium sp.]